jgi:phosphate acetyltransferase
VLQGQRKPDNDLSRGCTVEHIVNTVAITEIQAQAPVPATV